MTGRRGKRRIPRERRGRYKELGTDDRLQHDGRAAVTNAIRQPPDGPLAHRPVRLFAGQQERGDHAKRGLMTDDQHRLARVGPVRRGEDRANGRARRELRHRPELARQRGRRLLRAIGRRHQDAARIGQVALEPHGHAFGLLRSLRRQPAAEVRLAGLGFAMAPEDQVHQSAFTRVLIRSSNCACAATARSPFFGLHFTHAPSACEIPRVDVVREVDVEAFVDDAPAQFRVEDRKRDFDPAEQVAPHPVGRREPHVRLAAVLEIPDAMVLEEAAEDRAHADVLGRAGHARPQRARAAHDEVDLHPGLRRRLQRADHALLDQRVHLRLDARGPAFLRMLRLAADHLDDAPVHRERREQQALELRRLGEARDVQEHLVHVDANVRIRGQQAEVGVQRGRARMVVAGAQMRIRDEPRAARASRSRRSSSASFACVFSPNTP